LDRAPASLPDAAEEVFIERVAVGFAGPHPNAVIDRRHKNLAVADLAVRALEVMTPALSARFDGTASSILRFGRKFTTYSAPRVDLGVALLAAVTLDLRGWSCR